MVSNVEREKIGEPMWAKGFSEQEKRRTSDESKLNYFTVLFRIKIISLMKIKRKFSIKN